MANGFFAQSERLVSLLNGLLEELREASKSTIINTSNEEIIDTLSSYFGQIKLFFETENKYQDGYDEGTYLDRLQKLTQKAIALQQNREIDISSAGIEQIIQQSGLKGQNDALAEEIKKELETIGELLESMMNSELSNETIQQLMEIKITFQENISRLDKNEKNKQKTVDELTKFRETLEKICKNADSASIRGNSVADNVVALKQKKKGLFNAMSDFFNVLEKIDHRKISNSGDSKKIKEALIYFKLCQNYELATKFTYLFAVLNSYNESPTLHGRKILQSVLKLTKESKLLSSGQIRSKLFNVTDPKTKKPLIIDIYNSNLSADELRKIVGE